jgi:antitoxin component YwqK of YwqJK toxin-antitoxin module
MKRIYALILILSCVIFTQTSFCQTNETNVQGEKTGMWVVYGKDNSSNGHCGDCMVEEGEYVNGRKEGYWIKYFPDGVTPRLKANYKDGRPKGDYEKFHNNGVMSEKGTYTEKRQTGDFIVQNDQGIVTQKKTFNANGREDGLSQYFYDDGSIQMEMTKKDGTIQGKAVTYWENGDVKKEITYDASGKPGEPLFKDPVNPLTPQAVVAGTGGPSGTSGTIKDGKKYNRDGYNKLYNTDEELWMDGEFKTGKLWTGKLYKYDSDGILLKIEIWKKGAYHSDGVLD